MSFVDRKCDSPRNKRSVYDLFFSQLGKALREGFWEFKKY
jgi:hypothetical protein